MLRVHLVAAILCVHFHAALKQTPLTVVSLASIFSGPIWVTFPEWLTWTSAAIAVASMGALSINKFLVVAEKKYEPVTVAQATMICMGILLLIANSVLSSTTSSWISVGLSVGVPLIIQLLLRLETLKQKGA